MKRALLIAVMLVLSACAAPDRREHYAANPNVVEVVAGSVRSDEEARTICPTVCGTRGWIGTWHRVGSDNQSVCGCSNGAPATAILSPTAAPPASCSAAANGACSGCNVSCPAGQQALCAEGVTQAQNGGAASICSTSARCLCQ